MCTVNVGEYTARAVNRLSRAVSVMCECECECVRAYRVSGYAHVRGVCRVLLLLSGRDDGWP